MLGFHFQKNLDAGQLSEKRLSAWYNQSMTTLMITIDEATEAGLQRLSAQEGRQVSEHAAHLVARAVRASQPEPVYDIDSLKAAYAEFAEEDIALSEATVAEHAELLAFEDRA